MSCGPDCECSSLPEAHVVAVSVRGRVGYGVSWGADGSRNEGRQIYPDEGCPCPAAGVLTGVLRILEDAEKRNEMKVLITISICTLVDHLTEPINQLPFGCCRHLLRRIAECKVKGVYRRPCCYSKKGLQRAIFQARLITGTHSLSPNPINDNLFKNGVIGFAIYGEYKMTAGGEMKGAYACYFEEGFTDSHKQEMNKCEWVPDAKHEVVPFSVGLEETFSLLLHEQYRQVRIKTSSDHVVRWFDHMKNDHDEDLTKTPLCVLYSFYKLFRKVEVEYDPQDEKAGVLEAKKMVDALFESTVDGLYWKGGVPVVYTDGSVRGQGTERAVAGGGVFWGPDDPRNRTCQIIGPQTSSSGEFGAVVKALETAIQKKILRLVIRTDSQAVIDSVTVHLALWKENGWLKSNGELVKDREFLKKIDKLMGKMESVEFEKVLAHSGHEGNDGADRLAGEASTDAYNEVNFSPRYV